MMKASQFFFMAMLCLGLATIVNAGRTSRMLTVSVSAYGKNANAYAWDNGKGSGARTSGGSDRPSQRSRGNQQRDDQDDTGSSDSAYAHQEANSQDVSSKQQDSSRNKQQSSRSSQESFDDSASDDSTGQGSDNNQQDRSQGSDKQQTSNKNGQDGSNNGSNNQGDVVQGAGMQGVLQQHNSYRARHGVPALTWSSSVAATAQAYAEKCIFEHSGTKGLGENLATGYKDWTTAVKVWYDEEKEYDYSAGQFSHETGHFTAMVWKTTKQLGCGYAPCGGRPMYVCNYSPAGNIIGSFKENVPRPVAE